MHAVVQGFTNPRITTLRTNTLKTTPEKLRTSLASYGTILIPVAWYKDAFIVFNTPLRKLTELPPYKAGEFYVQSLSSMIPPLVLHPHAGDAVLDIAAAPGSKTTQMASLMQNSGEIIANDTSRTRRYRLQANLNTQGATIAKMTHVDGRAIWKTYPEYFDKVLVDVPCSMEGRFQADNPKTYKDWSVKKVRELSQLQRWMLRSAISATKPGGTIVYSTCTLSPEENESIIEWILRKDNGIVSVEHIDLPGIPTEPAVMHWLEKTYAPQIQQAIRLYPTTTMEGFFVVKLRKQTSSIPAGFGNFIGKPVFHKHLQKSGKRYMSGTKRNHKRIT